MEVIPARFAAEQEDDEWFVAEIESGRRWTPYLTQAEAVYWAHWMNAGNAKAMLEQDS